MTFALAVHTSSHSEAVDRAAQALARLHASDRTASWPADDLTDLTLDPAQPVKSRLVDLHSMRHKIEPEVTVLSGAPDQAELWWEFARTADGPLVLTPERCGVSKIGRVLLPLDGTAEASAVMPIVTKLLAANGVEFVVLHVFDRTTVPPFWDHTEHAHRIWAEEFLQRHCPASGATLVVRSGEAGAHVADVADEVGADLIVLGWSQRLNPGRARVVRATVERAHVPVLLLPVGHLPAGPSALIPPEAHR